MTKKDCAYTRKHLPRYLTGHLFGPQRQRIERHLRSCPVCSSEYDALRRIDETRSMLRDIDPPPGAGAALRRRASGLTRLLYRPLWLAAIVIGALSLGVAALQPVFVLSGLLLAAGFIGAGLYLYTAPDRVPQGELRK